MMCTCVSLIVYKFWRKRKSAQVQPESVTFNHIQLDSTAKNKNKRAHTHKIKPQRPKEI